MGPQQRGEGRAFSRDPFDLVRVNSGSERVRIENQPLRAKRRIRDRSSFKIFRCLDPAVSEGEYRVRRFCIDDGNELNRNRVVCAGKDHCACISEADLGSTRRNLLDSIDRALSTDNIYVQALCFIKAFVQSDKEVGMPSIETEICRERYVHGLRRGDTDEDHRHRCAGSHSSEHLHHNSPEGRASSCHPSAAARADVSFQIE